MTTTEERPQDVVPAKCRWSQRENPADAGDGFCTKCRAAGFC